MADLQEQLQAILGNPEAMGQIAAIARTFTGGAAPEEGPPPSGPQALEAEFVPVEDPASEGEPRSEGPAGGGRPGGQAPDLGALLGALGGGAMPDIDPRILRLALRVFSEYSARDDEKTALLAALKPFLREERREKMEKAEKAARLGRAIRVAIQLLKEEGMGRV